jgi:nicotinamide-nucleotide amidase
MFLNEEQQKLAEAIGAQLVDRGEKVAVSESTTGGLVSAALLSIGGASKFYAGGAVVYTLASRTALVGVPAERYENYNGTTPEMLAELAETMRVRLDATWCIAESGLAGPTPGRSGAPAGKTTLSVAGPVVRTEVMNTGIADREQNMVEFTTLALRYLSQAIKDAE